MFDAPPAKELTVMNRWTASALIALGAAAMSAGVWAMAFFAF
jgi:hypothetical protein